MNRAAHERDWAVWKTAVNTSTGAGSGAEVPLSSVEYILL